MADPRDEFLSRIDLKTTRVKAFNGFVFLCGGPQDINKPTPLLSARHLIYNELTSGKHSDLVGRLRLAEDIQDWFRGGKYHDLVTFEEHLASLSSVILLVVESAGSIAELGAFSVTKAISDRLIALVDEKHFEEESFIRLGPILRLERDSGRKALVYDWHEQDAFGRKTPKYDKLSGDLTQILDDVRDLLRANPGEKIFRHGEPAHVMLLICEICDLFGAISESEIKNYIQILDKRIDLSVVEQFLFLLEKCGLLSIKARGHGRYYYAPKWMAHIVFGFTDGPRLDRDRVRVDVVDYYKAHQKTRSDVVRVLRGAE